MTYSGNSIMKVKKFDALKLSGKDLRKHLAKLSEQSRLALFSHACRYPYYEELVLTLVDKFDVDPNLPCRMWGSPVALKMYDNYATSMPLKLVARGLDAQKAARKLSRQSYASISHLKKLEAHGADLSDVILFANAIKKGNPELMRDLIPYVQYDADDIGPVRNAPDYLLRSNHLGFDDVLNALNLLHDHFKEPFHFPGEALELFAKKAINAGSFGWATHLGLQASDLGLQASDWHPNPSVTRARRAHRVDAAMAKFLRSFAAMPIFKSKHIGAPHYRRSMESLFIEHGLVESSGVIIDMVASMKFEKGADLSPDFFQAISTFMPQIAQPAFLKRLRSAKFVP